jgi:hypothetical protein
MRLFRACAVPRLNHIVRTVPPSACKLFVASHDVTLLEAFATLQGFRSDDPLWERLLRLPLKLGGSGITSSADIAHLAYVASVSATLRLTSSPAFARIQNDIAGWLGCPDSTPPQWPGAGELGECLTTFLDRVARYQIDHPNFASAVMDQPTLFPRSLPALLNASDKLQRRLSQLHHEMDLSATLHSVSPAIRARVLSLQQVGASACYEAIPSCDYLTLSNDVYTFFAKSYQFIPELEQPLDRCPCRPDQEFVSSNHFEYCPLGAGTTDRHDNFAQSLTTCLRDANFVAHAHYHAQGAAEKMPDIEVFNYPTPGAFAFVEVSVISPFQDHRIRAAAEIPLSAATFREDEKKAKYRALAAATMHTVFAAVVETTGAFGRGLQSILATAASCADKAVFSETAHLRTWSSKSFKQYWTQRLAVAFWQGSFQMSIAQRLRREQMAPGSFPPGYAEAGAWLHANQDIFAGAQEGVANAGSVFSAEQLARIHRNRQDALRRRFRQAGAGAGAGARAGAGLHSSAGEQRATSNENHIPPPVSRPLVEGTNIFG